MSTGACTSWGFGVALCYLCLSFVSGTSFLHLAQLASALLISLHLLPLSCLFISSSVPLPTPILSPLPHFD